MKKNLEEMQVKVANKRAILQSHTGEEYDPITIGKNVLLDDGTNMQDFLDTQLEPSMTTMIENSQSMFKVGQGDSVDFSDNVMNGAYDEMMLKGKTLVNCIQGSSKETMVLPLTFEQGEYITINNTNNSSGINVEVKGKSMLNHCSSYDYEVVDSLTNDVDIELKQGKIRVTSCAKDASFRIGFPLTVKPCSNTTNSSKYNKYMIIINNSHNSTKSHKPSIGFHYAIINSQGVPLHQTPIYWNTKDTKLIIDNTGSSTEKNTHLFFECSGLLANDVFEIDFPILIEYQEGMEHWDIPYFQGMQCVKNPVIKTVGKNLFDKTNLEQGTSGTATTETGGLMWEETKSNSHSRVRMIKEIPIKPNTTYTISNNSNLQYSIKQFGGNGIAVHDTAWHNTPYTFTTKNETRLLVLQFKKSDDSIFTVEECQNANIQLEEDSKETTYESYKVSQVILPSEVNLKSLPNGICDTINLSTGEYIQRVGEKTVNGSESWGVNGQTNDFTTYWSRCLDMTSYVSSERKHINGRFSNNRTLKNCNKAFVDSDVNITFSKATVSEYGSFNNYLKENPITFYYQLKTPIITKLDLPSLKSFKGQTHLFTEVDDYSLCPFFIQTSSYVAYPVVIKPNTKYSIVANKDCNYHTDNLTYSFDLGGATVSCHANDTITTVTTPSTLEHHELRVSGSGLGIKEVRVVEGKITKDLPYFEGICDVKSPVIRNIGKNLLDIDGEWVGTDYSFNVPMQVHVNQVITKLAENEFRIDTGERYSRGFGQYINVEGLNEVRIRANITELDSKTTTRLVVLRLNKDEKLTTRISDNGHEFARRGLTETLPTDGMIDRVYPTNGYSTLFVNFSGRWQSNNNGNHSFTVKDLYVGANTEVESYQSNTTTFTTEDNEIIVLRSLPNGVCDTLNVRTGEYVQNIGETVLDGSDDENWSTNNTEGTTTNRFISPSLQNSNVDQTTGVGQFLCDKLKTEVWNQTSRLGLTINGQDVFIYNASIDYSASAIKQWLSQNPVTVQYELATPIVKQINVEGYPYAYENGHILLGSGSQEQSLTPTIEYSIVANRGGQIRSNQRMVERHQKKLDSLYAMTLVNMIDSQYNQTLMELKSALPKSEVVKWDM